MAEMMFGARILIVEDDDALAGLLKRILHREGYANLITISDPRRALPTFREWSPDLIIMDIQMPHIDGVDVMQQIRSRMKGDDFLPFLMITGDSADETRQRAVEAGATDFITKPFDGAEVLARVRNLLHLRFVQQELTKALEKSAERIRLLEIDMVRRFSLAVKLGTPNSGADDDRVADLAARIAATLDVPSDEVERIRHAAPLRDIGMMGVPDAILKSSQSLSLEELDEMRSHTAQGARILMNSELPLLQLAEEIALYHHEAWDGRGYTPGLAGEAIPLAARIVAVADTYCAMTGTRPYQEQISREDAVAWIESQSGSRFDPQVVQAFGRVCAMDDLPLLGSKTRPSE